MKKTLILKANVISYLKSIDFKYDNILEIVLENGGINSGRIRVKYRSKDLVEKKNIKILNQKQDWFDKLFFPKEHLKLDYIFTDYIYVTDFLFFILQTQLLTDKNNNYELEI
jgi:hypothetical protein